MDKVSSTPNIYPEGWTRTSLSTVMTISTIQELSLHGPSLGTAFLQKPTRVCLFFRTVTPKSTVHRMHPIPLHMAEALQWCPPQKKRHKALA